ncbi:DNA replication/repair protein RecF [Pseudahrensia aquimaris]|uniref:DNA replication and repair protein RecF n=1 Tax=Pseudahrensia aquimaris TaxID=744461 RepID=A0ABW3FGE0_9HYPH
MTAQTDLPTHIEQLKLFSFRNYASARLSLDHRHVVLTGENGAGKTNLLEAVSFLSPGRGLRRSVYGQVAREGGDGTWAVHAELNGPAGPVAIGTGLQHGAQGVEGQRRVHVNSATAKTSDVLLEHSRIVWLTPSMDGLFTGPKGDRRRFLDRLVLAIDPAHGRRVADYEKSMRARNKLLEDFSADKSWLVSIESQLAESAIAIAFARAELVDLLRAIIGRGETGPQAVFPNAEIALDGTLEDMMRAGSASDLEDEFRALLVRERGRDRAAGRMIDGPHRTDIAVRHGPKDMAAALCSTGEQKALLTGLVLAHANLVAEVSGMVPILLLDEIAAHLDAGRRAALFNLIDTLGCQAWMTGTDANLFDAMGERAQHFTVSDSRIVPT